MSASHGVNAAPQMADRFRGFLPVVLDLETGGFNPATNAILEVALVFVGFKGHKLVPVERWRRAVAPYPGSLCDPAALKVTGIDPKDPNRNALCEDTALKEMFRVVRHQIKAADCQRAILVAHNASFDQQFLNLAIARNDIKRNPFHPFSAIDTASLAAVAFGHTVLSEACARAGIAFEAARAHNALYDAERTAELFCTIVNRWPAPLNLGGDED
ncbi:MAG: ribonuclease T [Pseudomonadales bacterium]